MSANVHTCTVCNPYCWIWDRRLIICVWRCHVVLVGGCCCWHHPLRWLRTAWCVFAEQGFSSVKRAKRFSLQFSELDPLGFKLHITDAASRGKCYLRSTHAFQSILLSFWKQWRHDWHPSSACREDSVWLAPQPVSGSSQLNNLQMLH